jgi:uncharacterized tellurite resistance protein B-like protein
MTAAGIVRDRRLPHAARLVPVEASELLSQVIRAAYHDGQTPSDRDLQILARFYGLTPARMRDLVIQAAACHEQTDSLMTGAAS